MSNENNYFEITDAESKEFGEKVSMIFYSIPSLEPGCKSLLNTMYDHHTSDVHRKLQHQFYDEDLSKNLTSSLSYCYPWTRTLVHEFLQVVDAAINVGEIPTLEKFATLSALSYVPKQDQNRIFKHVIGLYPNNEKDVERANEIIRTVNLTMGLGHILEEYSVPGDKSDYEAKLNRRKKKKRKG
jgi:hypothetical protein